VEAEKLSSAEEDPPPKDDDFKLVKKRKKKAITKAEVPAAIKPKPTKEPVGVKRKRLPKTQAVVLEKPTGNTTYADMVKEIKTAVSQEALSFDITTRRAKSGNLILETNLKEHADDLASVLKRRLGESRAFRRPSPSVALLLIGVEDSVDEKELARTLLEHDPDLKTSNDLKIQEGKNGVRTAIVRVPMIPGRNLARMKKLKVGWATCRIKELASRKGCAKCSASDHATSKCKGEEKRKCFRCKAVGHLIASCMLSHQGGKSGEPDRGRRTGVPAEPPSSQPCP